MQTKPKSNSVVTTGKTDDGKLWFDVAGTGVRRYLNPSLVSPENREYAMLEGLSDRVVDGAAISRDAKTGLPASPEAKLAGITRLIEHLESGSTEWRIKVAPAAPKGPDVGLVIRAMMKVYPDKLPSVEACNAAFDRMAEKRGITRDAAIVVWAGTQQIIGALAEMAKEAAPTADDLLTDE